MAHGVKGQNFWKTNCGRLQLSTLILIKWKKKKGCEKGKKAMTCLNPLCMFSHFYTLINVVL